MAVWVADLSEAEAVADLLVEFRDWYGRDWPSDNSILASVEKLIEDPGTEYLLGSPDDDSPPAGVCQLRFRHSVWMAAPDCWLEDIYVREDARGAGLGGALIELALERARARGCRRVELDTSESNEGARRLYAKHGFSESAKSTPPAKDLFLGLYFDER